MKKIVIASANNHKVSEISIKIQPFFDQILSLADFPEIGEIIEDGNTIEENSFIKSKAAFKYTKIASVADDTILEVDALNGDPGLFTARYAGENATYEENMTKLLEKLDGIEDSARTARFRTIISYVNGKDDFHVEGIIEGKILNNRVGNNGFGYDPIFKPNGYNMTFGEIDSRIKNEISHRALATNKLVDFLRKVYD